MAATNWPVNHVAWRYQSFAIVPSGGFQFESALGVEAQQCADNSTKVVWPLLWPSRQRRAGIQKFEMERVDLHDQRDQKNDEAVHAPGQKPKSYLVEPALVSRLARGEFEEPCTTSEDWRALLAAQG